jgi:hypothetical protein
MQWDVSTCSQTFDRLARRIFRERRQSSFSWLPRLVFGQNSSLGVILQWLSWFFHDSCYDTRIFDFSLREAFQEDRRIFGVNSASPQPHSGTKFCVIATSIAKETRSFVFGNFNAVDWFSGEKHGQAFSASLRPHPRRVSVDGEHPLSTFADRVSFISCQRSR